MRPRPRGRGGPRAVAEPPLSRRESKGEWTDLWTQVLANRVHSEEYFPGSFFGSISNLPPSGLEPCASKTPGAHPSLLMALFAGCVPGQKILTALATSLQLVGVMGNAEASPGKGINQ